MISFLILGVFAIIVNINDKYALRDHRKMDDVFRN